MPVGQKREVLGWRCANCIGAAPTPVDVIALPAGAPFGAVEIDVDGCTLCLACVAACPTGALGDDPERPLLALHRRCLRAVRALQGDLSGKSHQPQAAARLPRCHRPARVLKEEEPFHCIRCGKPFGVKSTIERVSEKLEGQHWMYAKRLQTA